MATKETLTDVNDKIYDSTYPLPVVAYPGSSAPSSSPYSVKNLSVSSSGDNTAIAAVAAQVTRVFAMALTFAAPVDVTIKDGSTTLAVFIGVTSLVLDGLPNGAPLFVGTANTNFVVNLSAAVACKGAIWYAQS